MQDVLTAIRHGRTLDELADLRRPDGESYLKSAPRRLPRRSPPSDAGGRRRPDPRTARRLGRRSSQRRRAGRSCSVDLGFERYRFPGFPVPKGHTPFSYLEELCHEGARRRYHPMTPAVVKQLAHELDVIEKTGLAEFFLICWDLMRFASERGIPAQGRGSAANSIVAYVLGITRVDPIRHNLLFERFINEGRTSYPDVDIDFSSERREEVIQYVYGRYGPEHTGMVCNLVTYRARSAVREVGYALGFPRPLVDRVAKALETYDSVMVRRDLEADGGFGQFFAETVERERGRSGGRGGGRRPTERPRPARRRRERGLADGMGAAQARGCRVGAAVPAAAAGHRVGRPDRGGVGRGRTECRAADRQCRGRVAGCGQAATVGRGRRACRDPSGSCRGRRLAAPDGRSRRGDADAELAPDVLGQERLAPAISVTSATPASSRGMGAEIARTGSGRRGSGPMTGRRRPVDASTAWSDGPAESDRRRRWSRTRRAGEELVAGGPGDSAASVAGGRSVRPGPRTAGRARREPAAARLGPRRPPARAWPASSRSRRPQPARAAPPPACSDWERWLEFCARIDGFPRHLSIHSGGMLVTAAPLIDIAPLERATMPDRVVVQFDKRDVETLKLIKLDLLGLGMLAAIDETLQLIEHDCAACVDLDRLPEDIPEVFEMLQAADTVGVFQVESRAQMQTLPKSRPHEPGRPGRGGRDHPAGPDPGQRRPSVPAPQAGPRAGHLPPSQPRAGPARHPRRDPLPGAGHARSRSRVAGFTPAESDGFRRAMGTWRSSKEMEKLHQPASSTAASRSAA